MRKKLFQGLWIGLAASLLILPLWWNGSLNRWEYVTWSWRQQLFAKPGPQTDQIRLIMLDQASLDWGAQENGLPWPWPRSVYVPIIEFCKRAGARAVAFDILFTENSMSDSVDQDRELGAAVQRASNFVSVVFLGDQARQAREWPDFLPRRNPWLGADFGAFVPVEKGAAFPIPDISTNSALLASVREIPDEDGVFRRINLFRSFDGVQLPALGVAAQLLDPQTKVAAAEHHIAIGDRIVPVDSQGRAILRFRGKSGTHKI